MENDTLIQKFLQGKLADEEKAIFEKRLQTNSQFQEQVAFEKDVHRAIKMQKREALKAEMQDWGTENTYPSYKKWFMAASILLLGILSYFVLPSKTISPETLYASNFEAYRNVLFPVVRDEKALNSEEKAFMYYENGKYQKFISTLKESKNHNSDYTFYIANALMASQKLTAAKSILEDYIQNDNNRFLTQAQWYLGLIYLKENKVQKAKVLLEKVTSKNNFKTKEAKKILEELNSFFSKHH